MNKENEKLNAALGVVSDSVLHGWTIEAKIKYVRGILTPFYYSVNEGNKKGSLHCKSGTGIEDEETWKYLTSAIKSRFNGEAIEFYHNTNHNHTDFTIFFS